jgi:hypothetical protein
VERALSWCLRNPALASASALAVFGLVATAAVSTGAAFWQARAAARLQAALNRAEAGERQVREHVARQARSRAMELWDAQLQGGAVLWLARALELAPPGTEEFQQEVRNKLAEWGQQAGPRKPPLEHDDHVNQIAFSADGRLALTGSNDRTARLWDLAARRLLLTLRGHDAAVDAVAFSRDGKTVLTGDDNGVAKLWDTATGRLRHTLPAQPRAVTGALFSPDGTSVVTLTGFYCFGLPAQARLWDVATGRPRGDPLHHQGTLPTLGFSAGGELLWTWGKDRVARSWDTRTGRPAGRELPFPDVPDWRTGVAFGPDGRTVLVAGPGSAARCWDLTSGRPAGPAVTAQGTVRAVAFLRQGRAFLTYGAEANEFWDAATGRKLDSGTWAERCVWYFSGGQLRITPPSGGEKVFEAPAEEPGPAQVANCLQIMRTAEGCLDRRSSHDFEMYFKGSLGHQVEIMERGPVQGTPAQVRLWAEVVSREVLNDAGQWARLDEGAWHERRRHLEKEARRDGLPGPVALATGDPLFWLRREAEDRERRGDWSAALACLDRLIDAEPTAEHFDRRAEAQAARGKLDRAAQDCTRATRLNRPREPWKWYRVGLLSLAAGDRQGYAEARAALARLAQHLPDQEIASRADLHLLSPGAPPAGLLAALAKDAEDNPRDGRRWTRLAALQYRAGRVEPKVLERAEAASRTDTDPRGWLFLALICHHGDRDADARRWLDKAVGWLESSPNEHGADWWTILEARLLRREAAAALNYKGVAPAPKLSP